MADEDLFQRMMNQAKQEDLHRRFGAEFGSMDPTLPPEIVGAWLARIEEFEQRCSNAPFVTVRRFIGDPPVRPLTSLQADEIEMELEHLTELLHSNNITVHFGRSVSSAEAYRFLTEEVLSRDIEDIRMDGLTLTFLYPECQPDTEDEARMSADDFLHAFFARDRGILFCLLPPSTPASERTPFREQLERCLESILLFLDFSVKIRSCSVQRSSAIIHTAVTWSGLATGSLQTITGEGTAVLRLTSEGGLWYVADAEIPGLIPR